MNLENKSILLLGLGATGKEVLTYYKNQKLTITLVDDFYGKSTYEGNKVYKTKDILKMNLDIDVIIKSPGIRYSNEVLLKYNNVEVTNDIELAYYESLHRNLKIIGVTGTNGKTSIVTLISEVLKYSGYKSFACGNIGVSPLTILDQNKEIDYLVIELSSFQLKQIDKFKTYAAFILNITPDHLDYHEDFTDYFNSKLNIIKNKPTTGNVYVGGDFMLENINCILPEYNLLIEEESINMGLNINSIKLVAMFLESENIDLSNLYEYLTKNNKGIEHRIEFVTKVNDISYYNDSKATNVEASSLALQRLTNIILIVGGSDKNEDLDLLKNYTKNVKIIIAYGENKHKFNFSDNIIYVDNIYEATDVAKKSAVRGDNILLSPASASYDQFTSYIDRGNKFKTYVLEEGI